MGIALFPKAFFYAEAANASVFLRKTIAPHKHIFSITPSFSAVKSETAFMQTVPFVLRRN